MKVKTWISVLGAAFVAMGAQAQETTEQEIIDRIKPVGSVHVAGAQEAAPAGELSGEDVYKSACVNCHGVGVLGAPKLHDAADWQPRIDEKGLDTLWQNALNGINAMPPKGTCMTCTDDQIKAAIEYMIEGI